MSVRAVVFFYCESGGVKGGIGYECCARGAAGTIVTQGEGDYGADAREEVLFWVSAWGGEVGRSGGAGVPRGRLR